MTELVPDRVDTTCITSRPHFVSEEFALLLLYNETHNLICIIVVSQEELHASDLHHPSHIAPNQPIHALQSLD